ncbi:hypothetical protein, partial [Pseudomonas viridiflava]|uniref:hypothetical protein n=1 Tax=Pseudomonas viridiflava TaxID=33069 RepID=UPI00197E6192
YKAHDGAGRSYSGLELAMDFLGYRPATKRAQLGPFSGEASFTSLAILRQRLRRVLLSTLSRLCDSRLLSRSPHLYSGF